MEAIRDVAAAAAAEESDVVAQMSEMALDHESEGLEINVSLNNDEARVALKFEAKLGLTMLEKAKVDLFKSNFKLEESTKKYEKVLLNSNELTRKSLLNDRLGDISEDLNELENLALRRVKMLLRKPEGIDTYFENRCEEEWDLFVSEAPYSTRTAALSALKEHSYYYYAFICRVLQRKSQPMTLSDECRQCIRDEEIEIETDLDR